MNLSRLRELAERLNEKNVVPGEAPFIEMPTDNVIQLLDTIQMLKEALEYVTSDDPLATDPDGNYDYSSADSWKKLKARNALAKLEEEK